MRLGKLKKTDASAWQTRAGAHLTAIVLPVLSLLCIGIALLYYAVLGDLGAAEETLDAEPTLSDAPEQTIHLPDTDKTPAEDASEVAPPETAGETAVTITPSRSALTLSPGEQAGLSVTVEKPYGCEVLVFWSSSDESVASIDPDGRVTAIAPGTCELIASDGAARGVCVLTVTEPAAQAGYLLPSDTRLLTEDDLAGFDEQAVMLARNEIFARHGRTFQTASIQAYFNEQSWYQPDPDYDESAPDALSQIERANVNFLVAYETAQGWR